MPKRKPAVVKPVSDSRSESSPAVRPSRFAPSQTAIRETVESLVIAFMLAFLFRTFEAEMFVIPTGSMAPTLMGRHKDLVCPQCGYLFTANAASEIDQNSGEPTHNDVGSATCPMCHYTIRLQFDLPRGEDVSYNGDRIVVDKLAYQLGDPQRWDVAVFKFPGEAKQNYIKRVVGVGGETVRLQYGDVFIKPAGEREFRIARKTPNKVLAVLQPVYDTDYVCKTLNDAGWPQRWQSPQPGAWQAAGDHRWFSTDCTASGAVWIRYQHFEPNYYQWQQMRNQGRVDEPPQPLLISDFTAYDTSMGANEQAPRPAYQGLHWVGDLALECELDVRGSTGAALLELRKGGPKFTCQFDLSSGQAVLGIDALPNFHPTAATAVRGPGSYRVRFSNIDEQLLLWVNGAVVQFDAPTTYAGLDNHRPQASDLSPVGIASRQAALAVRHLRIRRDLYYLSLGSRLNDGHDLASLLPAGEAAATMYLSKVKSDPTLFEQLDDPGWCEFPLAKGQFLVLGDNSACSKDGRLWEGDNVEYFVRRDLLIGRALYIFWPHSWDRIDLGGWHVWCPFFPNFSRMRFVR